MAKNHFFRTIFKRLRTPYRLVIMNDSTLEERFSLKLSRLNVFVVLAILSFSLIILTVYLIAFTSLKEYIPGYGSQKEREMVYNLALKSDSIESELTARSIYLNSFFSILADADSSLLISNYSAFSDKKNAEIEENIRAEGLCFFKPIEGNIINPYAPEKRHFGTDISAHAESIIYSIADGTVLFSDWSLNSGNTIIVLHPSKVVSVYMHNKTLFAKQGETIRSGDPIAVIGNSGENTTGPHLHFELWINLLPVNPENYISF